MVSGRGDVESAEGREREKRMIYQSHQLIQARIDAIDAMETCRYAMIRGGDAGMLQRIRLHIRNAHWAEFAPTHKAVAHA